MAQNTELQEDYSSLVLKKLRKETIFRGLFNNKYEGSVKAGAVKVPYRDTEATVGAYTLATGKALTTSSTAYKTIVTDTDLAVNELVDGFVAKAVPDGLVADRLDSAAYSMAKALDDALVTLLTTSGKYTADSSTTALTASSVYASIVANVQAMKKLGVKAEEMWLAVPNDTYALLLQADEFIHASNAGDATVANGVVGKIAGVKVVETNNIADSTKIEYILGNNVYCHFVEEWNVPVSINDLMDGAHIGSSAIQGRIVCGFEVTRPTTVIIKKHA